MRIALIVASIPMMYQAPVQSAVAGKADTWDAGEDCETSEKIHVLSHRFGVWHYDVNPEVQLWALSRRGFNP
jgi:hypothetical protein